MAIFLFIFLVLLLAYTYIINYYRRAWNNIPELRMHPSRELSSTEGGAVHVSVIVAIRNEEHQLPRLIDNLLLQDYPRDKLELVFVDDHSTDQSWSLVNATVDVQFSTQKIQLPAGVSGKKKAIETGVRHANGELIVTTDADCSMGTGWIRSITAFYRDTHSRFIVAPVKMVSGRTLLGVFQRLDFMVLQGITGASVDKKLHAMCNGANLAYQRQTFFEVNGFEGIDHIPSGDDMLLMYKIFRKYPGEVGYLKSRDAIVTTPAEATWKKFFQQRIRWASKAVHYEDKKIFYVLLITYLVNVGFVVLAVAAVINSYWWWILGLLFLMKILIEFPFANSVAGFFGERRLMKYFPLFQPLHIIYMLAAGWLGRFGSYEWKSRTIKNKGNIKLSKR